MNDIVSIQIIRLSKFLGSRMKNLETKNFDGRITHLGSF